MSKKDSSTSLVLRSNEEVTSLLQSTTDIDSKIKILRDLRQDCLNEVTVYKKKYKKLKRTDDVVDASNALLTGTSISLTIVGLTVPPLLIASASISGLAFITARVQDKLNLKARYLQHHQTFTNYSNIAREITTVLTKNHLSGPEYLRYIRELFDKISLIEDSQLF